MALSKWAGQPAPQELLVDVHGLISAYESRCPDPSRPGERVAFGTSGHRGTSFENSFNEDHVAAISQALCEHRKRNRITGPLFLGKDTHALSEPALATAIEVFAANEVEVRLQSGGLFTPTPVISHAILAHNRGRRSDLADGVILTPSHNPPRDGGYKYNPPTGGPAGSEITKAIETRANAILEAGLHHVRAIPLERALAAATTSEVDLQGAYIRDLKEAIDFDVIRSADLRIGVDPMGGAAVALWDPLAREYGLNIEVVNRRVDPTFSFMTVDHDGVIRMDCSSPYAMAGLIALRDRFDIAFGNDPDTDRHGIVTRSGGLMNPNAYLAVAIDYLFRNRPGWGERTAVGKTLVSSSMIDRVAAGLGRTLVEVPVGFKWFVDGLLDGSLGFGGEESAGATFLRRDGRVWTTDKDGILLDLLAAEVTARTGKDPSAHYVALEERFGRPVYKRVDNPATPEQKLALLNLSPDDIEATTLAGEKITGKYSHAPGNGAAIGGLKVSAENGWFAARPSGTENVYKIYAESFKGEEHLARIQEEAGAMVDAAFRARALSGDPDPQEMPHSEGDASGHKPEERLPEA